MKIDSNVSNKYHKVKQQAHYYFYINFESDVMDPINSEYVGNFIFRTQLLILPNFRNITLIL